MLLRKIISTTVFLFLFSLICFAQTDGKTKTAQTPHKQIASPVKSSPAYAELLLRRTERESELEEFLLDYTEEFPKVKEIKFELSLINKEADKILAVQTSESGKLTLALGKLLVRKIELETDLWNLRRQYNDDHPEVKRAKRKVEVFERAIKKYELTLAPIALKTGPIFRNDRTLFASDLYHPNEKGYAVWMNVLKPALAEALVSQPSHCK